MLCGVVLCSLFGVVCRVSEVPVRDVRVVPGQYMVACFVMLRGFAVMLGCELMMFGCLKMMRSACVSCHCLEISLGEFKAERGPAVQGYHPPSSLDNQMNSR